MLDIRPLPDELEAAARKNINEVPERREKDIDHIKDWLQLQPHLRPRTDDQFLITFLRGCKFSLERTKEKLDAYYTYRTALPEFFRNRDPTLPELRDVFNKGILLPLGADSEGRCIWLFKMSLIDPDKHKVEDLLKAFFMMFEVMLLEDDALSIYGLRVIADCEKSSLAHVGLWTPTTIRKCMTVWEGGFPCRIGGLHYLNIPSFCETLINIVRSIVKEKIRKRISVYPNLESLHADGMMKVLPKEYGGNNDSIENLGKSLTKKMESYRDYFLEDEKYGVDESRRPGRPRSQEELFGMEGSFRQLSVD